MKNGMTENEMIIHILESLLKLGYSKEELKDVTLYTFAREWFEREDDEERVG